MRRRWRWLVAAVVVVVVLAVGGPFVYIHFIEGPAPAKLQLPTVRSTTGDTSHATTPAVAGTYHVGAGSVAGYRVTEVLIGQHSTAVGRTEEVWGTVTVAGTTVTGADISVNMASVKSDQSQRNAQFDGRIMAVTTYPTAKLTLTDPIDLGTLPGVGTKVGYSATAELAMHGVTRSVTFPLTAERTPDGIDVLADVHIAFSDWNIANPSVGGFVTTDSTGTLEVLLSLTRGAGNPARTGSATASAGGGGPVTVPSTTVPKLSIPSG